MLPMLLAQGLGMAGNALSSHLQSNQQEDLLKKQQEMQQQAVTNNAYNAPRQQQGSSLQALAAQNTAPGTNYYNRAAAEVGVSTHRGQASTPGTEASPTSPQYGQGGQYLAHTGVGQTQDIRGRANQLFIDNLTQQSQTIGNNLNADLSGQMNQQIGNEMAQGLGQSVGALNSQQGGGQFMNNMISQIGQQKANPMSFLQNIIGG